ncbi:MAG: alpha-hydroxy-acid oxidizing protein [Geminicoccales bacterium]
MDFALHPRWSSSILIQGRPECANFTDPGNGFDRTESRAATGWDSLAALRDQWPDKLVIKGVLTETLVLKSPPA